MFITKHIYVGVFLKCLWITVLILSRYTATPCGHLSKTQSIIFKRPKLYSCSSRLSHVVCFPLDLFTANGGAGSEQTEVGLGFSNTRWFHWALLVQAEDLPIHQAHPEKARANLCCSLCHRWGTKSILYQMVPLLFHSTSVNYINTAKDHFNWCHFKEAYAQLMNFPTTFFRLFVPPVLF